MNFKEQLRKDLEKQLKIKIQIEVPPNDQFGDLAVHSFKLKLPPQEMQKKIILPKYIEKTEIKGPYLNFFINKSLLAKTILKESSKKNYGKSNKGKGKTIVIDFSSPNIAKPFGIGHLRSTIIGNSIANIDSFLGYKTIKINYLGDWGTQFGKILVGYKYLGNDAELKKNPIKHMLDLYIKGNQKEYEYEARNWFKKLEEGDKEAIRLWKLFRELSWKNFQKIYKILNIKFDIISGESYYNGKMDRSLKELKSKNLIEESEGALIVNLNKYNLGVTLIQKTDGATLYITRDITAAKERYFKYKFHKMIYEVGQEQKLHFQQLFKIFELLDYPFANNCIHVHHGLYLDKDGKKFATRKGKTIFMEDILNKTIDLAKKTINEKNPKLKNKDEVARKVGVGAIIYGDLKNNRINDMIFNIERFLDFEGNTGPYLQYTYARASSILNKTKKRNLKIKIKSLENSEVKLIKKIAEFPEVVDLAEINLAPNIIANYVLVLAQSFNEFYHTCPVLKSDNESFRLKLVKCFTIVTKQSLNLLGIDVLKQM
ncbi:MAG TPA: arginine--tRNA ligase [Candidatus Nanoarchaeia archaeon]|nr:arginine--tRNA ligase [Candidatus Nanoarchaeia archaeon]